jgi:hypothetical protein
VDPAVVPIHEQEVNKLRLRYTAITSVTTSTAPALFKTVPETENRSGYPMATASEEFLSGW